MWTWTLVSLVASSIGAVGYALISASSSSGQNTWLAPERLPAPTGSPYDPGSTGPGSLDWTTNGGVVGWT